MVLQDELEMVVEVSNLVFHKTQLKTMFILFFITAKQFEFRGTWQVVNQPEEEKNHMIYKESTIYYVYIFDEFTFRRSS